MAIETEPGEPATWRARNRTSAKLRAEADGWPLFCRLLVFATRNNHPLDRPLAEKPALPSYAKLTPDEALAKVPAITLGFWLIKILATTLGETGGDTLSMTYNIGYFASSVIFSAPLILLVVAQINARRFHPLLYWATIIASTTAGTTMADFATRSIGIGYPGGSLLLFAGVLTCLIVWQFNTGSVAVEGVRSTKSETFYWLTITFSQTLGTALGDWAADDGGLGYLGGAVLFGGSLVALTALWRWSSISRVGLFWTAFILTRPLGATVGDFLDKPIAKGGLDFSRPLASATLAAAILILVLCVPQYPGGHPAILSLRKRN